MIIKVGTHYASPLQLLKKLLGGFSFEQTDFWQIPEMVFRGFSFEITDKVGGASMFHGMS